MIIKYEQIDETRDSVHRNVTNVIILVFCNNEILI